ncbi:MurR/RpiR family transcriptional regulator [Paenibacillus sediminis]|uniref:DNA-binding MurR/RpiR family transcriptional regulator n=1 Tax=Paenibacillus sediminis TaxID=664909 RepID=A0ABS4H3R9_9BACL|nr:MurR/RpiR family transcriptional regulator [Paenibacillus sediminis]MBP1937175.1 DNA-binding MurR/RpiR family transcriptional regulator [Paenibacillus sediminis]
MNGGLVRLREVCETLNPSERKVATFILQHPDQMVQMSVAELAESSGASQAAIVRLCKTMGIKGYQDLKLKVAGDLQEPVTAGYQDIRPNDSISAIIQNVSNNNIQSIRDTMKILEERMVERAVDMLNGAKRIYLFGVGASNLIAMDAQQKLLRINKVCFSFSDPHLQLTSAVMLTPEDAAVFISYSGETKEMVRAAEIAKEKGCQTISITKYGDSTLSRTVDIPLFTSSTDNEIRSGAMASRITQLNVIDILYLGIASRNYEHAVEYLEQSRQAIKRL